MEYELREEDGEVVKCDSCDFHAPTSGFNWAPGVKPKPEQPKRMLCEFCSTTMASRYTEYPADDLFGALRAEVWRAAACVFNMQAQGKTPNVNSAT
jgi:hypothetical protein